MSDEEHWKFIDGFENKYAVSNFGRVKSFKVSEKGTLLSRGTNDPNRYPSVVLYYCTAGKKVQISVHLLVAQYFLAPPTEELLKACQSTKIGKPMINHIDGNRWNNKVSNLEWCTYAHNNKDTYERGNGVDNRGEKSGMSKLKEQDIYDILQMRKDGKTERQIAIAKNVKRSTIASILQGFSWTHITGIQKKKQKARANVNTTRIAESEKR